MTVPLRDSPDADLMTGPPERFGELFERYSDQLYDYCARRVGRQLAEDLVADTFATAFAHRDRYDVTVPNARPWLFGILANLLHKHRRAEARGWRALARAGRDPLDGARPLDESFTDEVGDRLDARAATRSLAKALAAMPHEQREVLLLHVWACLDYPDLALALALPPGTVRSRLHRAKAKLRRALPSHYAPST
ncbi:RNA polymerase sigma factor [Micromonospora sp. NPDC004336]